MEEGTRALREEGDGVLLYYKYAAIPDVDALVRFYESSCRSLSLLGRVRIAPDGVNVTVGGKISSLEKHIESVRSQSLFEGTDFKLASCQRPSDDRVARECGFTSLSVRVVKELVTFRTDPLLKSPAVTNAGRHLSAAEFHSALQSSGDALGFQESMQKNQLLLLDARNVYETRIGKFKTPGVETLDPRIRQYSDLPAWIDDHSEQLHGKHVLMYCTGGIRCEMASAYIRSKGAGYQNVFQLYGGIQRYLEHFPGGGYFKGKNFVFDHRISVGSQDADIVGACLICRTPFDDYSSRYRCTFCRMLVLVCNSCQGKHSSEYICELCQKHGKGRGSMPFLLGNQLYGEPSPDSPGEVEIEPCPLSVDITSELSKRYGTFAKRYKYVEHIIEHSERRKYPPNTSLSFHFKGPRNESKGMIALAQLMGKLQPIGNNPEKKLRVLCLHGFRQNASSFKGRTSSLAKKLKNIVELVFVDAPHELPFIYQPSSSDQGQTSNSRKRFAWLISSKTNHSEPFDPLQYQQQTDGFENSYTYLSSIIRGMGPFDGVLGFSQGAAMAALFCEEQQRRFGALDFRFAILCSGFVAKSSHGFIKCPTLHIFGDGRGRKDRQIARQASMQLADAFDRRIVIEHDMGHIIPTRSPYIDRMKDFLLHFV